MSGSEFGLFTLLLLGFVGGARLFGDLFTRLRQPRVVGEILVGVLMGQALLGRFFPSVEGFLQSRFLADLGTNHVVLGFLSNMGLLLLMFASGAETKGLFQRHDRREIAWLGIVGTGLPFVAVFLFAPLIPVSALIGDSGQRVPLLMVVGIAMAVTSIPVISKILHDLHILNTRFARLVLGVAVLEDIVLWAVLAIATALAKSGAVPHRDIFLHIATTLLYFITGLTVMPRVLRAATRARWNVLAASSPVTYIFVVLLSYAGLAAICGVSLVFAAFLAGYAITSIMHVLEDAVTTVNKVAFAVFIPVYFAIIGYQLDLAKSFSLRILAGLLIVGCAVKLGSAGLGARLAGFSWSDSLNLSMAFNARGGPGIVLASVAYEAGIINSLFYTALVLFAVLTSQVTGAWLAFVLRKGWPLLSEQNTENQRAVGEKEVAA